MRICPKPVHFVELNLMKMGDFLDKYYPEVARKLHLERIKKFKELWQTEQLEYEKKYKSK